MKEVFENSVFAGTAISLITFYIGVLLRKKLKLSIINPILAAIVLTITILIIGKVDYDTYNKSAEYLSWFLTPATVCLAIPFYEKVELLKKNFAAVFSGIISGVITSLTVVFILSKLFLLNNSEYVTLLPKSITTAIGIGISEELGGYVTITVAVIVITGILGNVLAEFIFKIFKITEPIAKGVSAGSGAHVIGTVKAMEIGEVEGAMGSLSIAVSGILTVLLAPVFAGFIR